MTTAVKNLLDWCLSRLSENSTWRGIILCLTSIGVTINPQHIDTIVATGLAVVGLINILRVEPSNETTPSRPAPPTHAMD